MSAALAKMTFSAMWVALSVGSSSSAFGTAPAMQARVAPPMRLPSGKGLRVKFLQSIQAGKDSVSLSATGASIHRSTNAHHAPEPGQDTSHAAKASESKHDTETAYIFRRLSDFESEQRHMLNVSAKAMDRLNRDAAEVHAIRKLAASAEREQAAAAQELENSTAKLQSAKAWRLAVTTKDLDTNPLPALLNRSRKSLAKAQAKVTSAEDGLVEVTNKSRVAEKEMQKTTAKLRRALEQQTHSSKQAEAAHKQVMDFHKVVRVAQRHQARNVTELEGAAAEVQKLIAALKEALKKGGKQNVTASPAELEPSAAGSGPSASASPAPLDSFAKQAGQGGNGTAARAGASSHGNATYRTTSAA